MASGNLLAIFIPPDGTPPSTNYAQFDTITAVTGQRAVYDYDSTTSETIIYEGVMPDLYSGNGVTLHIGGAMDAENTGTRVVGIEAAFEKVASGDGLGSGGSEFASAQTVEITVNNTANNYFTGSLNFSNGAQMDSVVAGDRYRLRITRKTTGLTGTNATGDFQFYGAWLVEQ